ncbi:acetate--CoA ligase family protein [Desulfogranum mediterraneum]|uniref:acetate--CoA ligase family protein n=1 Tax=Desulfogranum mediterraneum TaxID=160661 RepID=UPI000423937F|nr:acetate--CoA ligase family protein [Desulfogranum mediterraneum]
MNLRERLLRIETKVDCDQLEQILSAAVEAGRFSLFEHEAYDFLRALGSETVPRSLLLPVGARIEGLDLDSFPGKSVVMKIVSPTIVHKTELKGVRIVDNNPDAIRSAWRRMLYEVPEQYCRLIESRQVVRPESYRGLQGEELLEAISVDIQGVLLVQFMPPDSEAFGNELIVGLRQTREFGMILSAGLGGTDTELYAKFFRKNRAIVSAPTASLNGVDFFELFRQTVSYRKLIGLTRGQQRIVTDEQLVECFAALIQVGNHFSANNPEALLHISEFEVNPFAFTDFRMVPLDGLLHFTPAAQPAPGRPIDKIDNLLHPRTIGIVGVSPRRVNFGRVILSNILKAGFDPAQLVLLHPEALEIDGVRCVAALTELEAPLDLLVVAVGSEHVPALIDTVIGQAAAQGVLLIPGGLGETEESRGRAGRLRQAIQDSRQLPGQGPIILGANSMGVISHPGSYDTWFLPEDKLPKQAQGARQRIAFISQSGAFMGTRMSRFPDLNPLYLISIGNQTDLTLGDFMDYFSRADRVDVIGIYAEGFNDLDGAVFAAAVRRAVAAGKEVVFYKAGRTPEGMEATSGHTASLAGDYAICEACLHQAGAIVAQTMEQFADLLKLAAMLHRVEISGKRIAGFSSAGFEAVGLADYIHTDDYALELAEFSAATTQTLEELMQANRLDKLVTVHNPLDINPGADDRVFAEVIRVLGQDPRIDGLVAGLIPITPAMHSLADGSEGYRRGIYHHMEQLRGSLTKALVLVVDGGRIFDPFVDDLEGLGFPVFRSMDRAVMALALYLEARLKAQG